MLLLWKKIPMITLMLISPFSEVKLFDNDSNLDFRIQIRLDVDHFYSIYFSHREGLVKKFNKVIKSLLHKCENRQAE